MIGTKKDAVGKAVKISRAAADIVAATASHSADIAKVNIKALATFAARKAAITAAVNTAAASTEAVASTVVGNTEAVSMEAVNTEAGNTVV